MDPGECLDCISMERKNVASKQREAMSRSTSLERVDKVDVLRQTCRVSDGEKAELMVTWSEPFPGGVIAALIKLAGVEDDGVES